MRKLTALIILAFALLLASACGGGGEEGSPTPTVTMVPTGEPTAAAEPTPTLEPPPTVPPSRTLGKIQTSDGKYSITKVYAGDRWPQDCSGVACSIGPASCFSCHSRLKEGFQLLVVSVEPKFPVPHVEGDVSSPLRGLSDLCVGEQAEQIYVVADDGSQILCFSFTTRFKGETFEEATLQFTPPVSAKGFTLFVPDNPPVDLGR